jgi:6-phosphogluconolactonase/glucosamine-6-phosphate isomerase/deaminase
VLAQLELHPSAAAGAARAVSARLRANAGAPRLLVGTDAGLLPTLEALAARPLAWARAGVWPASEIVVAESHPARRWEAVWGSLAVPARFNPIPVDPAADPTGARAALRYAAAFAEPPCRGVVDVALLLLRPDGGLAGLSPGSPLLRERGDTGATVTADGLAEVTVTLPLIARARAIVLVAPSACPDEIVRRVLAGDPGLPAGRLRHPAFVLCRDAKGA